MGRTRSPGPSWKPTAWAGPQQSQTHRGSHRRGVAAGRGRAAHCDQGHGARLGAPGPAPDREPSHSHTDSRCPAGPGRRDRSHQGLAPPRGRPLKGQTPVQPGLPSPHGAAALPSPCVSRCSARLAPAPQTRWGRSRGRGAGAEPGDRQGRGRVVRQLSTFARGSVPPPRKHPDPALPAPPS